MINAFQHIGMGVRDVDKAYSFYKRLFGYKIKLNDITTASKEMESVVGSLDTMRMARAMNVAGGGILEFIEHLNRASEPAHPEIIYIAAEHEGVGMEIALQYSSEFTENLHSYVNNICTTEGGTHVSGFRAALTRSLNSYGKKSGMFKVLTPSGDDFREGLTAVVSLRVPNPQFEGQTKTKLGNSEIEGIVQSTVGDSLSRFLEENPKTARVIVQKGMLAAEARESARKARLLVRERKGALSGGGLPGPNGASRSISSTRSSDRAESGR